MKKLLIWFSFITILNAGFVNIETGWEYQQSTFQAFYMLENTQIDGVTIEAADVIGAFNNGECVGWVYADPAGFTTIPLMGDDGGFPGYMVNGDVAELFIYDATYGSILPLTPGAELPGWENNAILIIDGASNASNIFGCTDSAACNYDPSATADDGSCWSPNEFCTCGDGEGAVAGCDDVCNSGLVLDDCGDCDGGNAAQDCAGVCYGSSYVDGCGVCDDDSSNDEVTCTGCTDECADNHDEGNLFDDGSCVYTIPGVEGLTAEPGPARVILSWTAPDVCGPALSYEVYDLDGNLVKETSNTTTQILNLPPEVEACFTVVALNANGSSENSEQACATPEIAGGISWGLQLTAGINGWGMYYEEDTYNYLGVAPNGTNDLDNGLDVPEPPVNSSGNYISLFFKHPEWGSVFGDNFTQDVRLEDDEYYQQNLTVWEAEVVSNMSGLAFIQLDHLNTIPDIPIYAEFGGQVVAVENGTLIEFFLQEGTSEMLTITIGNIVPEAPGNLSATGGDRSIALDWDDDEGYYPATSYNVYRDGVLIDNVSASTLFDNEDMEGHTGQGLLYESSYDYTVTGVNAAGESTNGHQVSNHDGSFTDVDGRQSDDSATTNDNINPVAELAYLATPNGIDILSLDGSLVGEYQIPHNWNPDANEITILVDGAGSFDEDEFDIISTYTWSQVGGPDVLSLSDSDTDTVSFNVSNANGGDDKVYTLNLHVTTDYPIKTVIDEDGVSNNGVGTRGDAAEISVTIYAEPNNAPTAPDPFEIIVIDDGAAVYTMDDADDANDYDSSTSLWVVPHDGSPNTNLAHLWFTADASSDIDDDDLTYHWNTGVNPEPFNDLNGDGTWSVNEPYVDLDGDGQWNDGDLNYNGINLDVEREAGDYTFYLTVIDVYGATATSEIVVGVEAEYNEAPTVSAGDDQEWYMPDGIDERTTTIDDNSGADSDNDALSFSWSADGFDSSGNSEGGWLALVQDLGVGDHTFTFTVTDSYGDWDSDDVTISIYDEPASPAVTNVETSNGLYYVEITFDEGILDPIENYEGALDNSVGYDIFRDGELIATLDDDGDLGGWYYLDNGLASSTEFNYDVQSFNSDGRRGDAVAASHTTGDRPTVQVLSPNGAEIWSVGDPYPVEVVTDNKEYIEFIDVQYSGDGGLTWDSAGEIDEDSESTEITSDGTEINNHAMVRVIVTDVGDFYNQNAQSNQDDSDNTFTMAAHALSKNYWTGWHLFGTPVNPYLELMDENLGLLGNWGESWIAYAQDGAFADLSLELGEGYYLALAQESSLILEGNPVISSDFSDADLVLEKGWNLRANPLVTIVDKDRLDVAYDGITLSWEDAVVEGWIAPHIIGWFEDTHYPSDQLVPFNGYWFHTSRDLTVKVRPHLQGAGSAREDSDMWSMNLSASPTDGLSGADFVQMSLRDGANNEFTYGEDEYDHPNPTMDSFIDLYFDKSEWLGTSDSRGIVVESPYFGNDVRSLEGDVHAWDVKADVYNVTGDIELNWTMDEIESDAHILIAGEAYDMRESTSITVSSLDDITVVIGDLEAYLAPSEFALSSAYPNPFNPTTTMDLSLNEAGHVNVMVYNVLGQIVSTLVNNHMDAGYHSISWDANNMPSGMYLVRVQAGSNVETQKLMLLK